MDLTENDLKEFFKDLEKKYSLMRNDFNENFLPYLEKYEKQEKNDQKNADFYREKIKAIKSALSQLIGNRKVKDNILRAFVAEIEGSMKVRMALHNLSQLYITSELHYHILFDTGVIDKSPLALKYLEKKFSKQKR